MKKKKNWIVTLIFLVIVIACVQVTQVAGKSEQKVDTTTVEEYFREKNREILAGLQGVHVVVEGFRPEVEKHGFNEQQYKTDVELRLRQYGIKVLSRKESYKVSGSPCLLSINVAPVINEKIGIAAVSYSVQLMEGVLLERNPSISTVATTWEKSGTTLVGLKRLDEVREYVRDLVDMFINDYLAANPKDQPSKTIQQTYVVPKNALLDMAACGVLLHWVSDPNLPQEKRVWVHKQGSFLIATQKIYLEDKFGLRDEDILARMSDLAENKKQGLFDYLE